MMFLTEETTVPVAALPMADLRAHLRLGSGFADDASQDEILERCLRAALSTIEGQCVKAVLTRRFNWSVDMWRDLARQVLPLAPVSTILSVTMVAQDGTRSPVEPGTYALQRDTHRPALVAAGYCLPAIPTGGQAEIVFDAGFGADWSQVPADLAQAVMILAAQFYDTRSGVSGTVSFPADVIRILAPYRNLRLIAGGRA